jgi:hypothetical protein
MYYRVYAKFDGQKKFKALDLSTGLQVNNLIRATLVHESSMKGVFELIELNKNTCSMKVKKVKNYIAKTRKYG